MDEDILTARFRASLVALLRDELEKVQAFTIEDLLGSDEMMDGLARAILAAPLAGGPRHLSVVRDPAHGAVQDALSAAPPGLEQHFPHGSVDE